MLLSLIYFANYLILSLIITVSFYIFNEKYRKKFREMSSQQFHAVVIYDLLCGFFISSFIAGLVYLF